MTDNEKTARPYSPDKTWAAINKTLSDLKRSCKVSGLLINIVIFAYYIYALIANRAEAHLFIINIIAFVCVSFSLGFNIYSAIKNETPKNKTGKRVVRYILHTVHIAAVSFALYESIVFYATPWKVTITAFMCLGVLISLLFEAVRYAFEKYSKLIMTGIEMDIEELKNSTLGKGFDAARNPKVTVIDLIDKPVAAVARWLHKDVAEKETETQEAQHSEKEDKNRDILYAIANEHAEEAEIKKQERIESSANRLKTNLKSIFSKKNGSSEDK